MRHIVLSLSGGLDSSTLLLRCLKEYDTVTALSFDYGQKHRVELERAESLVKYLNGNVEKAVSDQLGTITVLERNFNPITHEIIELAGLSKLLHSSLVDGGSEVPEGFYQEENQKDTVVPNRNKIFSSIIQAVALSISAKTGEECDIALGIHAGDHEIYPDCRQEFRDADDTAFRLGNWGAEKVHYFTPYLIVSKADILKDGIRLCKELKINFKDVYSRTITSYKPIYIVSRFELREGSMFPNGGVGIGGLVREGEWYSDYKSASSVERILSFIEVGEEDPIRYADETGPVSWEVVKDHAVKERDRFMGK